MNQPLIDYLALLEENKRLTEAKELDNEFIINLGKQLKAAQEKIKQLEATIHDMRGMQQQSDSPRGSERGNVPGALHALPSGGTMRRACSGD